MFYNSSSFYNFEHISLLMAVEQTDYKYVEVAHGIEKLIENGVLKTGDKLTSVRGLSKEKGISLSTAFKAYYHLESKGLIEARPQSGYYVRFTPQEFPELPSTGEPPEDALPPTLDEMVTSVYKDLGKPGLVNFSFAAPSYKLLPAAKLNKCIMQAFRDSETSCLNYEDVHGSEELRQQIARVAFNWGGVFKENDIVVTAGCMEALAFCLKAVTKPGDAVAIESPTYFGIFQVMETLGLKVVEIPTDPVTGIDLDYLKKAIPQFNIKACLFVTNFNNPLGSCMPESHKRELVDILAKQQIPLIEDDIYGELYFGKARPGTCKRYDKQGLVLYCSSFSKNLAPGYRLGYIIPGKFRDEIIRLKRMHIISTNTLVQAAVAQFLSKGRFELHLRHLRRDLHKNILRYSQAVYEYFPEGTRISRPQGGFVLWIELDKKADAFKFHKRALKQGIGIAPGQIFSVQGHYQNFFRISCGEPWSEKIEEGIRTLGRLV